MKRFKFLNLLILLSLIFALFACEINSGNDKETLNNDSSSLTIGEKIIEEYLALKNGETTIHTTWEFSGTILDMSETKFNTTYNNYEVRFILNVDGVKIGIYNGQVNGGYPTDISGLAIGVEVRVKGVISEQYSLTSGIYHADIEFSKPEISWKKDDDTKTDPVITSSNKVNFLMINDTHGAFTDSLDGYSIARVGSLVDELESKNGSYIKIANGDILQGSYISSKTYGYALIESLNLMDFDVFVIGNHEFDWTLDKIEVYKDGKLENGEADFPFLGANIFYKGTTNTPDWIDPYAIIDYNDLKVGIIGVIGGNQESDILSTNVEAYDFLDDPSELIEQYAKELRNEKACDVVVVATHDYNDDLNYKIANFDYESRVDSIFCAHTHWLVNESISRDDGVIIPIVQNYDKNETIQEVILSLDENNSMYSYVNNFYRASNYQYSSYFDELFTKYNYLVEEGSSVLGYTLNSLSRSDMGAMVTKAMFEHNFNSSIGSIDIALVNTGGVRASIEAGNIKVSDVFNTFPFENTVVLVKLYGRDLNKLLNNTYLYTHTNISSFDNNTIYVVALVDYVYYDTYNNYIFSNKVEEVKTNLLMRDVLIEYIKNNL